MTTQSSLKPNADRVPSVENANWVYVGFILLAGLVVRIPIYLAFRPITNGDGTEYTLTYFYWTKHVFFLGERTPVYPLFLGVAQWLAWLDPAPVLTTRAAYSAVLLQSALDLMAVVLFYFSLRFLRIRGGIAFGASLFFATIPAVCHLETCILNMSLAFASVAFVCWLFLFTMDCHDAGRDMRLAALCTGATLAVAILNRPELLIFCVILLLITAAVPRMPKLPDASSQLMALPSEPRHLATRPLGVTAWIAFPVAAGLLAWMTLMYVGIGEFRITTLSGWNQSRTVYNLFDHVDPEDRAIGEIMSRNYTQHASEGDRLNLREIMWQSYGELMANYNRYPISDPTRDPSAFHLWLYRAAHKTLGLVWISCGAEQEGYCEDFMRRRINTGDYLGKVSRKLARKYPVEWFHNVAANFVEESFNFSYTDEKPAILGAVSASAEGGEVDKDNFFVAPIASAEHAHAPLLTLVYVVTLVCAVGFPGVVFRKRDEHWLCDVAVTTLAAASIGTIVGTCVLAGFNRIYTMPHLGVFILCTAYSVENRTRIMSALIPAPLRQGVCRIWRGRAI